jgi:hypothetical protein
MPDFANWREFLPQLHGLPLLPCGAGEKGKAPIDHTTGGLLAGWQKAAFTPEQILAMNGKVRCVGTRTGPDADHIAFADIDGQSAIDLCLERDCTTADAGWTIKRDTSRSRLKVAFRVPEELRRYLLRPDGSPVGKCVLVTKPAVYELADDGKPVRGDDGKLITLEPAEQIEFFYGTGQCIVLGEHVESGGHYAWIGDPSKASAPTAPWWELILEVLDRSRTEARTTRSGLSRTAPAGSIKQSGPRTACPICGRNTSGACTQFTDGDKTRINCFEGQTFSPPVGLKVGETTLGADGRLYGFCGHGLNPSIGGFSTFIEHVERQQAAPPATSQQKRQAPQPARPATADVTHPDWPDEPDASSPAAEAPALPPIDQWDQALASLVDPAHPLYERNTVRRQIKAATIAAEHSLRASPQQVRARLIQKQRELIAGTAEKGTAGGDRASFSEKKWLIKDLIAEGCLTGVAAFAKVGKTKFAAALAAALIHQQPLMGNPSWLPAPGPHKLILWWTDQPGVDSAAYLKAVGLMENDGTLHPQIIRLYTEEDDLCWDDQGIDELIRITAANPGATLITDSFYANVQRIFGSDQEPDAGGALIDVQTLLSQGGHTHVCCFHSSKETGNTGVQAIRGHSSAAGVPSAVISLHFLERKCPSGSGKWVADKENSHRRMVTEGRLPYSDLLVHLDGATGQWQVIGQFQQALAELQSDERKGLTLDKLSSGQRETLEWVGSAMGLWNSPQGVTAHQVAACKIQHLSRQPTKSEIEIIRKQLTALARDGLLSQSRRANVTHWNYRTENG